MKSPSAVAVNVVVVMVVVVITTLVQANVSELEATISSIVPQQGRQNQSWQS